MGWLGLGAMGTPMARRLANTGKEVVAFDPTPERATGLAASLRSAASPAAAADGQDVLLVMVASPAQAEVAIFGPDGAVRGLRPGCRVVLLSTLGPAWVRSLPPRLPTGVRVVDAPVSGGVTRATEGSLLVLAAAAEPADTELLSALGEVVDVGTQVGQGQAMKMVNQVLCGVHIAAAAEALALAEAMGIDPALAWATVRKGAAASFMLDDRGRRMVAPVDGPVRSAVSLFVKDLGLVLDEARDAGLPTPLSAAAAGLFKGAADAGRATLDDSELFFYLREQRRTPGGSSDRPGV